MQKVLSKFDFSTDTVVIASLWAAFALGVPTKTGNYDFRHFIKSEGLSLSISASAPPMAALEDEKLPVVPVEPTQDIKLTRGAKLLVVGEHSAWPKLYSYGVIFERSQKTRTIKKFRPTPKPDYVKDITNLVKYIPVPLIPKQGPTEVYAVHVTVPPQDPSLPSQTVRERVEKPLVAPMVSRSLPTEEETLPIPVETDGLLKRQPNSADSSPITYKVADVSGDVKEHESPAAIATVTVPPTGTIQGTQGSSTTVLVNPAITLVATPPAVVAAQMSDVPTVTKGAPTTGATAFTPNLSVASIVASNTSVPSHNKNSVTINPKDPSAVDPVAKPTPSRMVAQSLETLDTMKTADVVASRQDGEEQRKDVFTVNGQIELTGGLVATGSTTKLDIQWANGNEVRVGAVDYSTGQFYVNVPSDNAGVVTVRLIDGTNRILGEGSIDLEGQNLAQQRSPAVTITVEPETAEIRGQLLSAYSVAGAFVPISGGEIYGPFGAHDGADKKGRFILNGLGSDSTLLMEAYAPQHWGTRVLTTARRSNKLRLFPIKMLDSLFELIGQDSGHPDFGLVWGEIKKKGTGSAGVQVQISDSTAIGPIYFNELRIPDKNLKATTSNGLFAFAKVQPGIQIVNAKLNNNELPSSVVSVSPSQVSLSEIMFKAAELTGQVFDPAIQENISAQVSVVGATSQTTSTDKGFHLKIPSSDPVIVVEAQPNQEYLKSRSVLGRTEINNTQVLAFRKDWVKDELKSVNVDFKDDGVVLGMVDGPAYRVQIDDAADPKQSIEKSEPQIFYFDNKGQLDPDRFEGRSGGGFLINRLAPGLHTVVVQSAGGEMTTSRLVVTDAHVASVFSVKLRP